MDIDLTQIVLLYVVLLVSLVVHEASHAATALLGGDRTAYQVGQVTLNPIPHIRREPFGTVILPLIVLFGSHGSMVLGYAHAPYDPLWAHRHPQRAALMSLAGPASNFALFGLALLGLKSLVWLGYADGFPRSEEFMFVAPVDDSHTVYALVKILSAFLFLNLLLGIFNLLPWPPLDGAGVVEGLAPSSVRGFFQYVRSQPVLLLIGIFASWKVVPLLFQPAILHVVRHWL